VGRGLRPTNQLPGQDSNLDKESQNPNAPQRKVGSDDTLRHTSPAGRSAGRSGGQGEGGAPDADLARIVEAWPALPAAIRRAVLALVGTVDQSER
jgi:hypothetical protein